MAELEKYLALQDNREYLSGAMAADKLIEGYFLNMLADTDIERIPGLREGEVLG